MRKATLLSALAVCGLMATPALAFPVHPNDDLVVGTPLLYDGTFVSGRDNNIFGMTFTFTVDVTQGSGYGLTIDSFGSHAQGTDTELSLYSADGTLLYAINDDYDTANFGDSYLSFGDATPAANPFDGDTTGNNPFNGNVLNLLAGTYVVVIGPYNCVWNTDNMQLTNQPNSISPGNWYCATNLFIVPTPGSFALFGLGGLAVVGGRRRRRLA